MGDGAKEKTRGDAPCCSSRVMDPSCLFTTDEGESGTQTRLTKQTTNKQQQQTTTVNNSKQEQENKRWECNATSKSSNQLKQTNQNADKDSSKVKKSVNANSFMYGAP